MVVEINVRNLPNRFFSPIFRRVVNRDDEITGFFRRFDGVQRVFDDDRLVERRS